MHEHNDMYYDMYNAKIVQQAFYNVSSKEHNSLWLCNSPELLSLEISSTVSGLEATVDTKVQEEAATTAGLPSSADNSGSSFLHRDKSILPSNATGLA